MAASGDAVDGVVLPPAFSDDEDSGLRSTPRGAAAGDGMFSSLLWGAANTGGSRAMGRGWWNLSRSTAHLGGDSKLWLLGRCYGDLSETSQESGGAGGVLDASGFLGDFSRIVWATYRKRLPTPLLDSEMTSDTGWGCMIRSGQMVLAQAMKCALVGRERRVESEDEWKATLGKIATWIADLKGSEHAYSLHAVVEAGLSKGMLPGQWYGPNAVAHVFQELTDRHIATGDGCARVAVFNDGVIYVDELNRRLCGAAPIDSAAGAQWNTQACILVPLRLGLDKCIDPTHIPALLATFRIPHSIGCIGGTPRHSLYFVGTKGSELIYLDPHTTRMAPTGTPLSDEDINSFQGANPRFMRAAAIDPSLALAFFCTSFSDFVDFRAQVERLKEEEGFSLFDIIDSTPEYARMGSFSYDGGLGDAHEDDEGNGYRGGAGGAGGAGGGPVDTSAEAVADGTLGSAVAAGDEDEWEFL